MSRVRDALKRANAMQISPAGYDEEAPVPAPKSLDEGRPRASRHFTQPVQGAVVREVFSEDLSGLALLSRLPGIREHYDEPGSVVRTIFSEDRVAGAAPQEAALDETNMDEAAAEEEFSNDAAPPAISRGLRTHPLLRHRWVRRLLRLAGVRLGWPVPTCQGITRLGRPCRGPSMANGFCRLHGGSRSGIVAQRTRSLLDRISHAR